MYLKIFFDEWETFISVGFSVLLIVAARLRVRTNIPSQENYLDIPFFYYDA